MGRNNIMTSIERTAYPLLNANRAISQKTLVDSYTLSKSELDHIYNIVRTNKLRLHYALQLKTFQVLGYFIEVAEVPETIIVHIRQQMPIATNIQIPAIHATTLYRHRQYIRRYLEIVPWGPKGSKSARRVAIQVAYRSALTLTIPADIINVVIEELRNQHFELPAFSTLCRLVRHVRFRADSSIYQGVFNNLAQKSLIPILEELLKVPQGKLHSPYQTLKRSPKTPRINNFKELINYHEWLISLGDMHPYLQDISKRKYIQFAQEAKSLNISNLMDISEARRYTLIACLIDYSQKKTKDNLAEVICKTMATIHKRARMELTTLREKHVKQTQEIAYFAHSILGSFKDNPKKPKTFLGKVSRTIDNKGGIDELTRTCEKIIACNSTNHYSLLWTYFKPRRSAIFNAFETISLGSSTQNSNLMRAFEFLISNRHKRSETLEAPADLNLNFVSDAWKQLVYEGRSKDNILNRRFFEICIFTYLSYELNSGDVFIKGADAFSDYRASLLTVGECEELLKEEPISSPLISKGADFVKSIKQELTEKVQKFDDLYTYLPDFSIDEKGVPSLKKTQTVKPTKETLQLITNIQELMPERSLLDILCNVHHATGWAFEFGPLSGSDARFTQSTERYILNAFCYGTGMGPAQTAKHVRSPITPDMLSWINQHHSSIKMLDSAKDRVIDYTKDFLITKAWGDGSRCAADGTLRNIYEDNLMAEAHFRYVSKGIIAYNHIADTYVALFSTFMRCGLWEAVAILDGLLKNNSTIKPTTIHADTQGQSTVVFGLAHLLGIKLMPRIRNWKELKLFRPDQGTSYKNIDAIFSDSIDWALIETHWQDLMQVVFSIKEGKISSALLLRKLGTYSRKNRLYLAFQELGRVIRTIFLTEYLSNLQLREIITDTTNKVEAYNALSDWVCFGSNTIVASNDPDEMEKAIKYNLLVSNCLIMQNMVDLTESIHALQASGVIISKQDIARLSPYLTGHLKRFGDFTLNLDAKQQDIERIKNLSIFNVTAKKQKTTITA